MPQVAQDGEQVPHLLAAGLVPAIPWRLCGALRVGGGCWCLFALGGWEIAVSARPRRCWGLVPWQWRGFPHPRIGRGELWGWGALVWAPLAWGRVRRGGVFQFRVSLALALGRRNSWGRSLA